MVSTQSIFKAFFFLKLFLKSIILSKETCICSRNNMQLLSTLRAFPNVLSPTHHQSILKYIKDQCISGTGRAVGCWTEAHNQTKDFSKWKKWKKKITFTTRYDQRTGHQRIQRRVWWFSVEVQTGQTSLETVTRLNLTRQVEVHVLTNATFIQQYHNDIRHQ